MRFRGPAVMLTAGAAIVLAATWGFAPPPAAHGPFVHVDVRHRPARW